MARYAFITRWHFNAAIERVWEEIAQAERWPSWWKSVVSVAADHSEGLGRYRIRWRTRLPYELTTEVRVVRKESLQFIEVAAVGDLDGFGLWHLVPDEAGTRVTYLWRVRTTRLWMNLLAPLARPAFEWNHDAVMRTGGQGLAQWLGATFKEL